MTVGLSCKVLSGTFEGDGALVAATELALISQCNPDETICNRSATVSGVYVIQQPSQAFPVVLYAFPMCCVVWTWDALFYGASDFVYNAKTVAVASFFGVVGAATINSLRRVFEPQNIPDKPRKNFIFLRWCARFFSSGNAIRASKPRAVHPLG